MAAARSARSCLIRRGGTNQKLACLRRLCYGVPESECQVFSFHNCSHSTLCCVCCLATVRKRAEGPCVFSGTRSQLCNFLHLPSSSNAICLLAPITNVSCLFLVFVGPIILMYVHDVFWVPMCDSAARYHQALPQEQKLFCCANGVQATAHRLTSQSSVELC